MFEIGFWELVLVAVVALIVVGPERLPSLARTAGLWVGKARRMIADVKMEVDRELQLDELKKSFRQQADLSGLKDVSHQMKSLQEDIQAEFDHAGPISWRSTPPTHVAPASLESNPSVAPSPPLSTPIQLTKADPRQVGPPPAAAPVSAAPAPSIPPADAIP